MAFCWFTTDRRFCTTLFPNLMLPCCGFGKAPHHHLFPSCHRLFLKSSYFTYGLPEWQRDAIRQSKNIANPGCFATAIQLALLPLAQAGVLQEIFVTGITGATGAGKSLQSSLHFSWRANNISAYKTLDHQHVHEVKQTLTCLQPGDKRLHFIPWRGDFTRGIFVSCCTPFDGSTTDAEALYQQFYADAPPWL
jgi:N-acetyl-gamma-glutamyl-phosphate reductase